MRYTDLHRHLDGSLRPGTLQRLAARAGVGLPNDIRFQAGMGLDDALARFAITVACLQEPEAVREVAAEICEDAAREQVDTLEIRFAPRLHRSAAPEAIIDAVVDGCDGRAGVILCVLYGDHPELAENLVRIAKHRPGVVGLDLAGGPQPAHQYGMHDYAKAFGMAREFGLGRTVHAGEGRPAAEIGVAIETLHAQRIGHGTTLLDDPAILELVQKRAVVIEACPTSNVHTGVIDRVASHPLVRWLDRGVRVCINTDNTLLSGVNAPQEYAHAAAIPGMTEEHVQACIRTGRAAAFVR